MIHPDKMNVVLLSAIVLILVGIPDDVHSQAVCSKKSDVVFAVDQSGSITDGNPKNGSWDNWVLIKQFINRLIQSMNVSYDGTHVGLLTFGNIAVKRFLLTDYTDSNSVMNAVNNLPRGQGETNLQAGLSMMRTQLFSSDFGARPDVPHVAIVITDGMANIQTENTIPEAVACQNAGITIFCVGITDKINEDQLKAVSSPPQQKGVNYWTTPDFTQLSTVLASVHNATCNPPKIDTAQCNILDIAFAFDVPQRNWTTVKNFAKQFITQYLRIGFDAVRVAVVTYDGRGATVVFNLTAYSDESQIKYAIDLIPNVPSGNADVTYALNALTQTVFKAGNRTGGQSVAVLLMDNALVNLNTAVAAAQRLRALGIRVVPIDMTSTVGLMNLRSLASRATDVIVTADYSFLASKVPQLATVICSADGGYQCPMVADIILILDQSTSIVAAPGGNANWYTYAIGFATAIAEAFPIGPNDTRLGVIKFSNYGSPAIYLNDASNIDQLRAKIHALEIDGGETNIADALRDTRQVMFSPSKGARPNVPRLAILVTDGQANVEATQTIPEATMTKNASIELYTVGITSSVDTAQLQAICSSPWESHYFYVGDYSKLTTIITDLIAKSCITTTTQSTAPTTTTTTPVTTRTTTPTTTTPTTTTPTTTTPTTTTPTTTTPTTTTPTTTTPTTTTPTTTTPTTTTPTTTTPTTTTPTTTTPTTTTPTTTTPTTTTPTTTTPTTTTPTTTTPTTTTPTTTTPTTTTPTTTTPTTTTPTTTTPTTTTPTTTTPTTTTPTTTTPTTTTPTTTTPTTTTPTTTTPTTTLDIRHGESTRRPNDAASGGPCLKEVDVAFVIDKTSNMNYDNYQGIILEMVARVITNIQIDTRRVMVALVTFSDSPTVEFYFNNYSSGSEMAAAIRVASYGGSKANLADALRLTRTDVFSAANGHRTNQNITSVIVVITDNVSTNRTATLSEAALARGAGINLITIGIGTYVDMYELSAVASYPYKVNMIVNNTVKALQDTDFQNRVQSLICNNDGSCSGQAICGTTGTCKESFNEFMCSCSPERTGRYCNNSCTNDVDVVFALDVSRSLGLAAFQSSTQFVARIVQNLRIGGSNNFEPKVSQVGILTFGTTVQMQFQLNQYNDMKMLLQAINVPYAADSSTDLAQAISYARDVMFKPENGDRPNVPNYLCIVTDGPSTNSTAAWLESVTARSMGINIIVIGVGQFVSTTEMISVASAPESSNVILVPDAASFSDVIVNNVSASLCGNMDRCSQMTYCQNGATCKNTVGGIMCGPCPPGFTGAMCERKCTGKIDLVIMLDSAGTVHYERFQNLTNFAISIVNAMDVGLDQTRVALVYWGGEGYAGFLLNQFSTKQDVIQAIRNTPYLGNKTNTASAFRVLRRTIFVEANGDRKDAENFVVFVANGESTVDSALTVAEAIQSRLNGNHMITVGVETQMQHSLELEAIASFPRDFNSFYSPTFRALPNVTSGVVAAMCNSTDYCLSNPCQNGGRCVSGYGQYTCNCPTGYAGINCQRRCTRQMDVVFILDVSGSVEEEYRRSVAFARAVVAGLDVASGAVRVGAIAYSTGINGQFYLNQNIGKQSGVINSLDFYNIGGTTNTPLALTEVKNNHFTSTRGDRPGVDNIAVLVSDGYSNVNEAQTIPLSQQLRDSGVAVYSVAVGESPQMDELNAMVSPPIDDHVVRLEMDSDMMAAVDTLLDKLCPQ